MQEDVNARGLLEIDLKVLGSEPSENEIAKSLGELEDLVAGYAAGARNTTTGNFRGRTEALEPKVQELLKPGDF